MSKISTLENKTVERIQVLNMKKKNHNRQRGIYDVFLVSLYLRIHNGTISVFIRFSESTLGSPLGEILVKLEMEPGTKSTQSYRRVEDPRKVSCLRLSLSDTTLDS